MTAEPHEHPSKIPVGISECLLGKSVRYDGGHKHSRFCTDVLGEYFEFVSFCPEVAIGLGVPRQPIRLVGNFEQPQAVGVKDSSLNVTGRLKAEAANRAPQLQSLCGYIFMKDSPSCGVFSAKVYTDAGVHSKRRAGLFAAEVLANYPCLPVEENGRLNDARIRENFIARVFMYREWRTQVEPQPSPANLVTFHSRYKYAIMAHSQVLYRRLGRLVAECGRADIHRVCDNYICDLMQSTVRPPTRKGHANALYHLVGYLKREIPGPIRQELVDSIEDYRKEIVPLAVPMRLVQHYLTNYASDYVNSQSYLNPYPYALGLRNAI